MDLLTQLQTKVDGLSERFYTYVGVLGVAPQTEDASELLQSASTFATEILALSKEIELLIDSLPGADTTDAEQRERLLALDQRSSQLAVELTMLIDSAENKLATIRSVLRSLAQASIDTH